MSKFEFVSATRKDEDYFWRTAFLAATLRNFENREDVLYSIYFENKKSLGAVYNEAIMRSDADYIILLHDDVFIFDDLVFDKIEKAHESYDVFGLAGALVPCGASPSWMHKSVDLSRDRFLELHEKNGGEIYHGSIFNNYQSKFGQTPAKAYLVDGLFISINRKKILSSGVLFDEQFDFHFYDLDFSKQVVSSGLRLGIWPIDVIHQSVGGDYFSASWKKMYAKYEDKWGVK